MKTYSQSGQDLFAKFVCAGASQPRFIDIGCSSPDWQSNSKLLLEDGWKGVGVDAQNWSEQWARYPAMKFIHGDARAVNWEDQRVNYLSCDVDANTLAAMENLFRCGVMFTCATVEHDAYRFGDGPREALRALMQSRGYEAALLDVSHNGSPYEDWWIAASLPKARKAEIRKFCAELHKRET